MKICKDCRHVSRIGHPPNEWTCEHPKNVSTETDPVAGFTYPKYKIELCREMRSIPGGYCGHDGLWFEPKEGLK